MNVKRWGIAIPLAGVTTCAILLVMISLVATGRSAFTEDQSGAVVDFVRVKQDEVIQEKNRKPERPPEPRPPPQTPDMPQPRLLQNSQSTGFEIGAVDIDPSVDIGTGIGAGGDGEYLPIVKVAPIYPQRALTRGLEGWVLLEFTVTPAGTVKDPVVVEADPTGVFDGAAKDAALKFKYKPRVIDGRPVEVQGVRNLIRFELER